MRLFLEHREKWIFVLIIAIAVYFGYGRTSSKHETSHHVDSSISSASDSEFNQKIEHFIMNNPEIIIKSLEQMQIRKATEEQERVSSLLLGKKADLESSAFAPFLGNKDAKNIIVALYDYNCDYCKKLNVILNELVSKNTDVRVVLKQLPVINEASFYMAKMALAVYYSNPEKFQTFHNTIFSNDISMTKEKMQEIISSLGMDYAKLEESMDAGNVRDEIRRVHDVANSTHINGVPALIINNEVYPGVMQLEKIEEVLAKQQAPISEAKPEHGAVEPKPASTPNK